MYVIFPADEIIFLSYGLSEHPRVLRRPTLDILISPSAPLNSTGIRPQPDSNLDIESSSTAAQRPSRQSSSASRKELINSQPNSQPFSLSQTPHRASISQSNRNTTPNQTEQTNHITPPSPSSRLNSTQVSFAADFMNKSRTSVVEELSPRINDLGISSSECANSPKKKNNIRSKISKISLSKLGRPPSNESENASSRLREDLDLRIANPTFTRENLREKNFDAFFASGEPVYSLEKKDKQLSNASTISLVATPDINVCEVETLRLIDSPNPSSSRRNSSSFFPLKISSKPLIPPRSRHDNSRSKVVEHSVKGDRCHSHDNLLRYVWSSLFFFLSLNTIQKHQKCGFFSGQSVN